MKTALINVVVALANLPEFRRAASYVVDRATKLGVTPPAIVYAPAVAGSVDVAITPASHETNGTRLVAVVSYLGAKALVRKLAQDVDGVEAYRNAPADCDACQATRNRKDTFIVQLNTGRLVQLGRTCLNRYGLNPSETLAASTVLGDCYGLTQDDWSEASPQIGGRTCMSLLAYTTLCVCSARLDGYLTRGKAWDQGRPGDSTATMAWEIGKNDVTDADKAKALCIVTLATDKLVAYTGDSDYLHNLSAVVAFGAVEKKTDGLAASLIGWYAKATAVEAPKGTIHYGEPKKRVKGISVSVLSMREYDNDFGGGVVVNMQTIHNGDLASLVWWASGKIPTGMETGATLCIDMTPKTHGEYRGEPQTTVNRVAIHKPKVKRKRKPKVK